MRSVGYVFIVKQVKVEIFILKYNWFITINFAVKQSNAVLHIYIHIY